VQELTDPWTFVTSWYNLPFSLALLAFLGLSALQFVGLGHDHDADVEADAGLDVDHDLDLDHNLDLDHDLELDHDADLDHDLDHNVDHSLEGAPAWLGVLEFLGVGHAPVTMILLVLLGSFGLLGWIANWLLLGAIPVSVDPNFIFQGVKRQLQ
jgi:hypothetical protein